MSRGAEHHDAEVARGRPPWRRLVAEAVTITASILLALAVNAWWDGRKDRREERESLLRAKAEFAVNAQRLADAKQARHDVQVATEAFMVLTLPRVGTGIPVDVPGSVIAQVLGWYTFDALNGNITSMISSGTLRLIRNDSLRIFLASWPDLVRDVNEDEYVDRSLVQEELTPLMMVAMPAQPAYKRGQRPDARFAIGLSTYNLVNRRRISALEIQEDMDSLAIDIRRIRSLIDRELRR